MIKDLMYIELKTGYSDDGPCLLYTSYRLYPSMQKVSNTGWKVRSVSVSLKK